MCTVKTASSAIPKDTVALSDDESGAARYPALMHPSLPSLTALAVAAMRGMADDPHTPGQPLDPYAEGLLPQPLSKIAQWLRQASKTPRGETAVRYGLLGLWDHVVLRTLAIDRLTSSAVDTGIEQLVLLGAGLDARAQRLEALQHTTVWEVDHPDTQSLKKQAATREGVHFVGVNFEKDAVDEALLAAGFNTERRACFVWEGVTPYLPVKATQETLEAIARIAAPGSRLAVTYATPDMIDLPGPLQPVGHTAFRALGEPLLGLTPSPVFAEHLRAHGFALLEDTGSADWSRRYGRGRRPAVVVHERLAHAVRVPHSL